jgi:hypothetical protein
MRIPESENLGPDFAETAGGWVRIENHIRMIIYDRLGANAPATGGPLRLISTTIPVSIYQYYDRVYLNPHYDLPRGTNSKHSH